LPTVGRFNRTTERSRRAASWLPALAVLGTIAAPTAVADSFDPTADERTNPSTITLPSSGSANPYPSTIDVKNLYGKIEKVTVQLRAFTHTSPDDADVLLVGPGGQAVVVMSDAGGNKSTSNVGLTFDDAAPTSLPDATAISSGTYKPTNHLRLGADNFAGPAPPPPFGATLSTLNGSSPNGTWRLFVTDDEAEDAGSIVGWTLNITASPVGGTCSNNFALTNNDDDFEGKLGGDRVAARAGNDVLRGDGNQDCLSGGSGRDTINGDSDRDRIRGNSDRDRLSGDSGNDRVGGDSGNDRVSGGSGNDVVSGGSGNDRISGGSGRDRISGNSGNDRIDALGGRRERLRARGGRRDRINCGTGRDFVRADSFDIIASNCERVSRARTSRRGSS
jgi:Ca2+-binding RTX toxin-like protein